MKILVINCSPVRNGATAEIVNIVSRFMNRGNEVHKVCIDDYHISFCKDCRKCHTIALRTGPNMPECESVIGLCSVECKEAVEGRMDEIEQVCGLILNS